MLLRRRPAVSFSTWFSIPEQNMKDLEILNRASAIIVPARSPDFKSKFHVVTCSHVIAPWKWPKYYPEEWVQAVDQTHTHYTAEFRQDDGIFSTQSELAPVSYHHPTKDLAIMHFENEDDQIKTLKEFGIVPVDLYPSDKPVLSAGEPMEFSGHEIRSVSQLGTAPGSEEMDNRLPFPRLINGKFEFTTLVQQFARSASVLSQGMCGGPAFVESGDANKPFVYGIVDGIIPMDHPDERLRGLVSVLPSADIEAFIHHVEKGLVQPLLGGHAARFVGSDQDPDKLDLNKVFKKHA